MFVELKDLVLPNQTVAVAISGGSDSVALLHYIHNARKIYGFNVIAINVEHGIRGESSISDSNFVKKLCEKWNVKLFSYQVDSVKKANSEKLSLEQAARTLRYECFYDALNKGLCDKIATAHHLRDNAESVLFNLFRGTGISGITGIAQNYENRIIRPFLNVSKEEIQKYVIENQLEFVTDQTNFDDDYTRNYIRLNILPQIEKIFPEFEKSIARFSLIAKTENDYMNEQANSAVCKENEIVQISLPLHPALLARASVIAMKEVGIKKDWEKTHVDAILTLADAKNGAQITLKNGVVAIKEYNKIVFTLPQKASDEQIPFGIGNFELGNAKVGVNLINRPQTLKDELFGDLEKIPQTAVIRFKRDGDVFTKFGGGTKSLGDYLTDKKIPLRLRNFIPLIANGNEILVIFGVSISEKIKVGENSTKIIKFTKEGV